MELSLVAVFALAGWVWLVFFRGGFWRADQKLCAPIADRSEWPEVAVVIPARNEAENICTAISSLLAQDYPGRFSIIIVDDNSDDATAAVAAGCGKVSVVSGKVLARGWTGKLWAMAQGLGLGQRTHSLRAYHSLSEVWDMVVLSTGLYSRPFVEAVLLPAAAFLYLMMTISSFIRYWRGRGGEWKGRLYNAR